MPSAGMEDRCDGGEVRSTRAPGKLGFKTTPLKYSGRRPNEYMQGKSVRAVPRAGESDQTPAVNHRSQSRPPAFCASRARGEFCRRRGWNTDVTAARCDRPGVPKKSRGSAGPPATSGGVLAVAAQGAALLLICTADRARLPVCAAVGCCTCSFQPSGARGEFCRRRERTADATADRARCTHLAVPAYASACTTSQ